jgi:prepilin-type N-terminal cleavage/methylation domain-containing protein
VSVQRRQTSRVGGRGFSLFEIVIVAAVIAILAVIGIPIYNETLRNYRLSGAAGAVVSEIRGLQSRAITEGGFFRLHSGRDPNSPVNNGFPGQYRIERSTDGITNWTPTTNVWINLSSNFQGVSFEHIRDNGAALVACYCIQFNSRGAVANTGVTFPLTIRTTGPSGTQRTVVVQRTGSVRVTSP